MGLELITSRARVTCPSDWAYQVLIQTSTPITPCSCRLSHMSLTKLRPPTHYLSHFLTVSAGTSLSTHHFSHSLLCSIDLLVHQSSSPDELKCPPCTCLHPCVPYCAVVLLGATRTLVSVSAGSLVLPGSWQLALHGSSLPHHLLSHFQQVPGSVRGTPSISYHHIYTFVHIFAHPHLLQGSLQQLAALFFLNILLHLPPPSIFHVAAWVIF